MKRILAILLATVLCMANVYAVSSASGSFNEVKDIVPEQTVRLNLTSMDWFSFGFSSDQEKTAPQGDTQLNLSDENSSIADNTKEGSELYVWWDITTNDSFTVAVKMSGPLTYNSSNEIDWTVKRDETDVSSLGTGAQSINLSSPDSISMDFVESFDDSMLHTYSGIQKLYIATKAGELEGMPAGEYTATLTLAITNQ